MSLRAVERPGHRCTTRHAQAIYPFVATGGLGSRGVFVGRDPSGGAFCYDPWVLYADGTPYNKAPRNPPWWDYALGRLLIAKDPPLKARTGDRNSRASGGTSSTTDTERDSASRDLRRWIRRRAYSRSSTQKRASPRPAAWPRSHSARARIMNPDCTASFEKIRMGCWPSNVEPSCPRGLLRCPRLWLAGSPPHPPSVRQTSSQA